MFIGKNTPVWHSGLERNHSAISERRTYFRTATIRKVSPTGRKGIDGPCATLHFDDGTDTVVVGDALEIIQQITTIETEG